VLLVAVILTELDSQHVKGFVTCFKDENAEVLKRKMTQMYLSHGSWLCHYLPKERLTCGRLNREACPCLSMLVTFVSL
jgi:hypothetical protein